MSSSPAGTRPTSPGGPCADVWVVLPTYNEAENLGPISSAILGRLPGCMLLVVDDSSPDGTGALADALAADEPRIRVLHRHAKQGLGRAYVDGFAVALDSGAGRIVQMDADWSHDPAALPDLVAPLLRGADLVIGSRYVRGGSVVDWGVGRRLISRSGSLFARTVLGLSAHDLTGGFKAWRRETLQAIPWDAVHAGGYVFQIETTFLAARAGARIVELPIVFRDRRVGVSKMSRRIIAEALLVVLTLRWEELRGRRPAPVPVAGRETGSVGSEGMLPALPPEGSSADDVPGLAAEDADGAPELPAGGAPSGTPAGTAGAADGHA